MTWIVVAAAVTFVLWLGFRKRPGEPLGRIDPPTERAGQYLGEVVGESHYQRELAEVAGGYSASGHEIEIEARIVLEDDNPHDPLAVAVYIGTEKVGHLSRGHARRFRRDAQQGVRVFMCRALIVGGWTDGRERGYFGVKLDM